MMLRDLIKATQVVLTRSWSAAQSYRTPTSNKPDEEAGDIP